jgi:hypothetical protein
MYACYARRWLDGTPYDWNQFRPASESGDLQIYETTPAGAAPPCLGWANFYNHVMVGLRCNSSWTFTCKVPFQPATVANSSSGGSTELAVAADGVRFEAPSLPRALSFHQAERVCQGRGGHLAAPTTQAQADAAWAACKAALAVQAAGLASAPAACWLGMYCPTGVESLTINGFGIEGAAALAFLNPQLGGAEYFRMPPGGCSNASAYYSLMSGQALPASGSSTSSAWPAAGSAVSSAAASYDASGAGSAEPVCLALVQQAGSVAGTTPVLQRVSCAATAAYVCGTPQTATDDSRSLQPPQLNTTAPAIQTPMQVPAVPANAYRYDGCYAATPRSASSGSQALLGSATPAPSVLPILLSPAAPAVERCYSLAVQAGLRYFSVVGGAACWAGAWHPTTDAYAYALESDATCMQPCAGGAHNSTTTPGCAVGGSAAVFVASNATASGPATDHTTASPEAPTGGWLCMESFAVLGASVLGQLHVAPSQWGRCTALCARMERCHAVTYSSEMQACMLLEAPGKQLADVRLADAWWAATTCVKPGAVWSGASLKQLGAAREWHACGEVEVDSSAAQALTPAWSPGTGQGPLAMLGAAPAPLPGEAALTPLNAVYVGPGNMSACADACASNRTCQAAVVLKGWCFTRRVRECHMRAWWGRGGSSQLLMALRLNCHVVYVFEMGGGAACQAQLLGHNLHSNAPRLAHRAAPLPRPAHAQELSTTSNATAAPSAWLRLPPLSGAAPAAVTASMCLPLYRLPPPPLFVCTQEQDARGVDISRMHNSSAGACRTACQQNPQCALLLLLSNGTCVLRTRPYFGHPQADGSNSRRAAVALACLHTQRLMIRKLTSAIAGAPSFGRFGAGALERTHAGRQAGSHACVAQGGVAI